MNQLAQYISQQWAHCLHIYNVYSYLTYVGVCLTWEIIVVYSVVAMMYDIQIVTNIIEFEVNKLLNCTIG